MNVKLTPGRVMRGAGVGAAIGWLMAFFVELSDDEVRNAAPLSPLPPIRIRQPRRPIIAIVALALVGATVATATA